MKQTRSLAAIFIASIALFFFACNSAKEKTAENVPDSSQMKATETTQENQATAPKTIGMLIIQHKVANFGKWKSSYDGNDSARKPSGLSKYSVSVGINDPSMVRVMLRMTDLNRAREMTSSQELADRMKAAGVIGVPKVNYMEEVWRDTTTIPQTERVQMILKVKNWNTWKRAFEGNRQARMDAGLIDRVIGHEIGDNQTAIVILAITDMTKAKAFLNSKELRDKRAEAGVEGTPDTFFFNVVELTR